MQDYTYQTCKSSDRVTRWTVVLDYFIGIIPFFFVSTIYNINEILSRGFVRKMQNIFSNICDGKPAMTETVDGYASYTPKTYLCALDMHKRMRNLYKNATKNREKVVAWNGKCILTNSAWATMIEQVKNTGNVMTKTVGRRQTPKRAGGGESPVIVAAVWTSLLNSSPNIVVGAAGTLPLSGDAYVGMQ